MIYQMNRKISQFRMEEDESHPFPRISEEWPEEQSAIRPADSSGKLCEGAQLNELYRACERFRLFIEEIEGLAHTELREDVVAYCSGQKRGDRVQETLRPECLRKKMEVRIEKMVKTKRIKRNWGEEDLKILIWIVSKYCDYKGILDIEKDMSKEDWRFVASLIPGVTAETCMFKWLSLKKVTLATHNWKPRESELLSQLVGERLGQGNCGQVREWKEISQELYRLNGDPEKVYRNAKQCRQHWTCYLSPQLKKGPWQLYEDVKLLKFIRDNKGLKKWSEIARNFEGRTENALKNRYTLIIEKQKRLPRNKHKAQLTLIAQYLEKCYVDQFTANVRTETEQEIQSVYQSEQQPKEEQKTACKREEVMNYDTNESVITPVRVQKFSINDFQALTANFFKHIQPGVIESDGTFKKIPSTLFKENSTSQRQVKLEASSAIAVVKTEAQSKGPFTISLIK